MRRCPMASVITTFLIGMAVFCGVTTHAAKAPVSEADLKQEASHIVCATVLEVTSEIQKSKREKGLGNKDKVYSIRIRIDSSEKGEGLKAGSEIVVTAWKTHKRIGIARIGVQGQEFVPEKGGKARFYLKNSGSLYEPIIPNGITSIKSSQ